MFSALIILLVCILGSAFFSGIETGIISIHRTRLRQRAEEGEASAKVLQRFVEDPDKLLGTTLVGTNICNVIIAVMSFSLVGQWAGPWSGLIAGVSSTLVILVFGEYLPKAWFQSKAFDRCNRFAGTLNMFRLIFYPLSRTATLLSHVLVPASRSGQSAADAVLTREELKLLATESEQYGTLKTSERQMIHRVFELSSRPARDIMIQRAQIVHLSPEATLEELILVARRTRLTRFPVYDPRTSLFVGLINIYDVMKHFNEPGTLSEYMQPLLFISADMPIDDIFPRLRLSHKPLCMVKDSSGDVIGLITTEDILEEIVGDIET